MPCPCPPSEGIPTAVSVRLPTLRAAEFVLRVVAVPLTGGRPGDTPAVQLSRTMGKMLCDPRGARLPFQHGGQLYALGAGEVASAIAGFASRCGNWAEHQEQFCALWKDVVHAVDSVVAAMPRSDSADVAYSYRCLLFHRPVLGITFTTLLRSIPPWRRHRRCADAALARLQDSDLHRLVHRLLKRSPDAAAHLAQARGAALGGRTWLCEAGAACTFGPGCCFDTAPRSAGQPSADRFRLSGDSCGAAPETTWGCAGYDGNTGGTVRPQSCSGRVAGYGAPFGGHSAQAPRNTDVAPTSIAPTAIRDLEECPAVVRAVLGALEFEDEK